MTAQNKMKLTIAISLFSLFFIKPTYALMFNISIWEKEQDCQEILCLPKTLINEGPIEVVEPELNSFTKLQIPYKNILINFTLIKKEDFGGYYVFQTELKTVSKKTFSLCSRYESFTSFESAPVGACGGAYPNTNKLIGVSIYKIQE